MRKSQARPTRLCSNGAAQAVLRVLGAWVSRASQEDELARKFHILLSIDTINEVISIVQAVEFENQRNGSSGIAGGAGAARHLFNTTREMKNPRPTRSNLFLNSKD